MPFPELEQYKCQDVEVASLLTSLEDYLVEVLHRPPHDLQSFYKHPTHDINPLWVANKVGVSVERAYALLYMCLKAGIITPRYDIYCPQVREIICSVYSPDDLPREVECHYHDFETEHSIDDYEVMLFFQFAPRLVQGDLKMAV